MTTTEQIAELVNEAIFENNVCKLKSLLDEYDVDITDGVGLKPVSAAAMHGNAEIMKLVLSYKPDLYCDLISNPLTEAITHGHYESAKLLVEHGASLTMVDMIGTRPLAAACDTLDFQMVDLIANEMCLRGLREEVLKEAESIEMCLIPEDVSSYDDVALEENSNEFRMKEIANYLKMF